MQKRDPFFFPNLSTVTNVENQSRSLLIFFLDFFLSEDMEIQGRAKVELIDGLSKRILYHLEVQCKEP